MRTKLLIIMILPILLLECQSSIWTMITKKESKLFSEVEKLLLIDTTSAIDFKYGFDPDLNIDYVFKAGTFTGKEISSKSPEMKKALLKYKTADIISFYEKIVQLKETQIWKMNFFRGKENWEDSTYIQKYTLPEAEQFLGILETNVIQIDAAYGGEIEKRKTAIKKIVTDKLQKELEDKENKLNGSY